MKRTIATLAITLSLFSCGKLKSEKESEAVMTAVTLAEPIQFESTTDKETKSESFKNAGKEDEAGLKIPAKEEVSQKITTQIIKNANVQFQVRDVDASHHKIAALLKQHNSYFGSDNKSSNTYQIENNMVIRVPAADFEKLMDELIKESVYTNYKNVTAEDVTAEFVDIQARLKTKKEVEERYLALLKQANKVPDILEVEEKLRVIREEIEASEGRLKLLKDQVGYSTITLNAYQKLDYTPEPQIGFLSNLCEAFVRGWRSLVELFINLVRVWPFVVLFGALLFFGIRRFRRRKA